VYGSEGQLGQQHRAGLALAAPPLPLWKRTWLRHA